MEPIVETLRAKVKGEVSGVLRDRHAVSHDASIYELVPDVVVAPKDSGDIQAVVKTILKYKALHPTLALTPRSAGTDMSGGSLGSSITLEMTPHFNKIINLKGDLLHVQPGVYVRDIDPLLDAHHLQLGSAPASRALCTIGGMVGNNAGGEQSLRYGNTEQAVKEMKVVLGDGNEYNIKPLARKDLLKKMAEKTYEGRLYKQVYELIEGNYDAIKNARPKVNKNSMGYNLWSVWDRETGIFDLTHLFTGSQGTLGIITDLTLQAVPKAPHSGLLLAYLPSLRHLGDIIQTVLEHQPATFEGFDDITFNLGIRYFTTFRKQLGNKEYLRQQTRLLKSVAKFQGHLPHIILMIEFDGQSQAEVFKKIENLAQSLKRYKLRVDIEGNERSSAPFWQIRRAALSLLRNQIKGRYAAPFIDDLAVQPRFLPHFIPELRRIVRKYKLPATIQGHFGDGNFHFIPLLDIAGTKDQAKLEPVMRELVPIVLKYGGTMAGEHNDGMVRGPWLPAVFGQEMYALFKKTKEIFDPQYIFNPHKKTDASWEYSMSHIRDNNESALL
ncbi:MAG TPA: FAD-binding oxidoreductase [Dongiaceae bacterium]|nr:FAD-binding oxidoreductase [Dongiaceae bacterium]